MITAIMLGSFITLMLLRVPVAISITLAGTDPEGSTLTYALASNPSKGTATLSGKTVTYAPTANYSGSDSFEQQIVVDAEARGPHRFDYDPDTGSVVQIVHDPDGVDEWRILAEVDWAASAEEGKAVLRWQGLARAAADYN